MSVGVVTIVLPELIPAEDIGRGDRTSTLRSFTRGCPVKRERHRKSPLRGDKAGDAPPVSAEAANFGS
jgi:hypothetical protein